MSYSFSADAVQYGRDSAYYVQDVTDGSQSTIPGNVQISGNLVVEGSSTSGPVTANLIGTPGPSYAGIQLTTVNSNPTVLFQEGASQAGVYYDGTANSLTLGIGSNPAVNTLSTFASAGAISTPASVVVGTPTSTASAPRVTVQDVTGSSFLTAGVLSLDDATAVFTSTGTGFNLGPATSVFNILGALNVPSATSTITINGNNFTQYYITMSGFRFIWGKAITGPSTSYTGLPLPAVPGGTTANVLSVNLTPLPNGQSADLRWGATCATIDSAAQVTVNIYNSSDLTGVTNGQYFYFVVQQT